MKTDVIIEQIKKNLAEAAEILAAVKLATGKAGR